MILLHNSFMEKFKVINDFICFVMVLKNVGFLLKGEIFKIQIRFVTYAYQSPPLCSRRHYLVFLLILFLGYLEQYFLHVKFQETKHSPARTQNSWRSIPLPPPQPPPPPTPPPKIPCKGQNHRVHILVEMKQGQCICPLSWSVPRG
jgi:hypothetical protein